MMEKGTERTGEDVHKPRTWEKAHKPRLRMLLDRVLNWNADYIIPVGRKSGKLFHTLGKMKRALYRKVFYKYHFEIASTPLKGKKVAVIDDIARTCSTLSTYRDFFEEKLAKVRTFALVGHVNIIENPESCYDHSAEIDAYVTEPSYRDFLLGEAEYLLKEGFYQDVNHLTIEMEIPSFGSDKNGSIQRFLKNHGYFHPVPPYDGYPQKWTIMNPDFYNTSFTSEPPKGIIKLRFHGIAGPTICVPMVLPELRIIDKCQLPNLKTPFELPCQMLRKREHIMDELCYMSTSLLLSADLGKTLLALLLRKFGKTPEFENKIRKLEVRPYDFYRYFGIQAGKDLQEGIQRFLFAEHFKPDDGLKAYLNRIIVPRQVDDKCGAFSEGAIAEIISHLREGYKSACEREGTRKGTHYTISLDKMKQISGANEMLIVESLDSLCDIGCLVPSTDVTENLIQRTWRTGETEYDASWIRTQVLIPLAIRVMADEIGSLENKISSSSLMKALANFIYDYPAQPPLIGRMHRLIREPDIHGPTVRAYHPILAPSPVPIYDHKRLGDRYYKKQDSGSAIGHERVFFKVRPRALEDLSVHFDNSQEIGLDEINAYFSFLAQLQKRMGSIDILVALSICRNWDVFYFNLYKNITLWTEEYGIFLDRLRIPYSEDTRKGPLHRSGEVVGAGLKKTSLWRRFTKLTKMMDLKMDEVRFRTPLKKILDNVENMQTPPVLKDAKRILAIQRALTGLTLAKLLPEQSRRTKREAMRWVKAEFEKHKFKFDVENFWPTSDLNSIRSRLQSAFYDICYMVDSTIPKPKPESESMNISKAYVQRAHNKAATFCKTHSVNCSGFVQWDLTGSRDSGEEVVPKTADLYNICDTETDQYHGQLVTSRPGGDDRLVAIFRSPIAALRAAATSKEKLDSRNIPVKVGISRALVEQGKEHSTLIPAMGLAKDLCELKTLNYRNRNDVLLPSSLMEYFKSKGLSGQYFTPLDDVTIDGLEIKNSTSPTIFKFDWKRFRLDNR